MTVSGNGNTATGGAASRVDDKDGGAEYADAGAGAGADDDEDADDDAE